MNARIWHLLKLSIFFVSFAFFQRSQATEWLEFYNTTRSLGMGGTSVAISSDETALFRNPANLGSVRGVYGTFLDPELEGSSNFVSHVSSNSTGKAFEVEEVNRIMD